MTQLHGERCTACRPDSPQVTEAEVRQLLPLILEWRILEEPIKKLERVYLFKDFVEALKFTNKVGAIAEEEGHHPALTTEWGRTTVRWWTHAIRGLHRNDFIMAAKTDRLYNGDS